ncbi:MAG: class I tRNA ligase family protein, partial [Patescibacteria group bacterium]|nr:class I tRNA ligase family protein [Patescibacteria group bacterium]
MFKPIEENHNFIEMEKKWLKYWYENGIVKKYLNKNKNSKKYFSFLDGPITANNPMGVHHAWGRTYKDLWPKFHNLLGYKQRFQNGFDCQGLWVEVEVEKELGLKTKKDIENLVPGDKFASIAKFVQLCKDRVYRFSKIQTEQSKRLGYFADWEHSYFTMSDENNYMIWTFLKKCYENGWIYKGQESVPWCPRCETAISQHEMLTEDYKEVFHESIYFKLKIKNIAKNSKKEDQYLLVWTTTPWTLLANIAVAVDKSFDYSLVELKNGEQYWLAKDLVNSVIGNNLKKIIKTVKGKDLVGLKYIGPFDDLPAVKKTAQENPDKFHIVIATDEKIMPISLTEGTGMVHTAVSAGTEDYK